MEGPDLVNLLLLAFEILPSRFEVLSLIECGLCVCSQFVQLILEGKVTPWTKLTHPGLTGIRKLTGDSFIGHNNLILSSVNALYVLQGMENGLEVLLIMQQILQIVSSAENQRSDDKRIPPPLTIGGITLGSFRTRYTRSKSWSNRIRGSQHPLWPR